MIPAGWGENDEVIVCTRVTEAGWALAGVLTAPCELCTETIFAAPTSVERSRQAGAHLICRECFAPMTVGNQIRFLGCVTPQTPRPWEK